MKNKFVLLLFILGVALLVSVLVDSYANKPVKTERKLNPTTNSSKINSENNKQKPDNSDENITNSEDSGYKIKVEFSDEDLSEDEKIDILDKILGELSEKGIIIGKNQYHFTKKFERQILEEKYWDNLRTTYIPGVYCQQVDDEGKYSHQRHFFYNQEKEEMVEISGVYYISKKEQLGPLLNEYEEYGVKTNSFKYKNKVYTIPRFE